VKTETAVAAYESVLQKGGCIKPRRDSMDQRIVNDVLNGTGRIIDVQGGFPHGTTYPLTVAAWPVLTATPAPQDTDHDGMPDEWEKQKGLNPADASDATKRTLSTGYTNIEVYVNSLVADLY
jgi:hypothetical protein